MPEDVEDHVAQMFHGLVADFQSADLKQAEAELLKEREKRAALRHSQPNHGMNAGELLRKLDGDPADEQRKIQDELTKIEKDSKAAAAAKDKSGEQLPQGFFPPPPTSG